MESKIQIDVNVHRQERILIKMVPTEDLRDKLVQMFLQTALSGKDVNDGYCRLSILAEHVDGSINAELIPIHPIDMVRHMAIIRENADKFKEADPLPAVQ